MKNLKKVIALIIVAVMALSLNTFALNIAFDETLETVPWTYVGSNDKYICTVLNTDTYGDYTGCVARIYKNIDGKWTDYAKAISSYTQGEEKLWFTIGGLIVTKNNKLIMKLVPSYGKGTYQIADVNLDDLTQGEVHEEVDGLYSSSYVPTDVYIDRFQVIGDKLWITKEQWGNRIIAFNYMDNRNIKDFYWSHMLSGWSTTADRNYTYKINDEGNCEIYDANAWKTLSGDYIDYTDLKWTVQVPEAGIAAIQVSGNYLTIVSEDNMVYGYKLAGEAVDGVLPYTEIGNIYGAYGSMDMFDKYAAIYTKSGKKLYIFNIETGAPENDFNIATGDDPNSYVEFNETGVAVVHVNGGIDLFEMVTDIEMNCDMLNAQYNEDWTKMSVKVTVVNGTLDDFADGKVILATYEGEELIDVSVKDLPVASGQSSYVWTDYVDITTVTKAFYWTSGYAPIIDTPFVDIWTGEDE